MTTGAGKGTFAHKGQERQRPKAQCPEGTSKGQALTHSEVLWHALCQCFDSSHFPIASRDPKWPAVLKAKNMLQMHMLSSACDVCTGEHVPDEYESQVVSEFWRSIDWSFVDCLL